MTSPNNENNINRNFVELYPLFPSKQFLTSNLRIHQLHFHLIITFMKDKFFVHIRGLPRPQNHRKQRLKVLQLTVNSTRDIVKPDVSDFIEQHSYVPTAN